MCFKSNAHPSHTLGSEADRNTFMVCGPHTLVLERGTLMLMEDGITPIEKGSAYYKSELAKFHESPSSMLISYLSNVTINYKVEKIKSMSNHTTQT